ncbi:MAG: CoA transferase [Alteripontixanthobacter sp.]
MWLDQPRSPNSPLAGLKVLELARVLAGPWAGQMLADLGADVIKVESPEGDNTRAWGPPWVEHGGEKTSAYYHACNRGKRGIVADFRETEQLARVKALAAEADVVIENFKPGALAKFGLDHESLSAANPALITCSVTGFGQTGPRRDEPGYDFVIQAMSGMMSLTGEPEGEPMKHGLSISDLSCGLYAANAIQAALLMRYRTGTGQWIDMSLLDCSVAMLANQAMSYLVTGNNPPRMGNAHAQVSAYGVFPTQNGPVVLAPANDALFRKLLALLGRSDLLEDERFATNADRIADRDTIDAIISEETRGWEQACLLAECAKVGVPAGPINDLDQVLADPQIAARGMRIAPDGVPGLRSPFRFSEAELALGAPSPSKGQHGIS